MRKYDANEIDRMRDALMTLFWRNNPLGLAFEGEQERVVENRLRTHLLAGTEPEELEKEAKVFRDGRRR